MGLPTLPFMGKDPHGNLEEIGPLQRGFLYFVVSPLWKACNRVLQGRVQFLVDNLVSNQQHWEAVSNGVEVDDDQPFQEAPNDYLDTAKEVAAVRIQTNWRKKALAKERPPGPDNAVLDPCSPGGEVHRAVRRSVALHRHFNADELGASA